MKDLLTQIKLALSNNLYYLALFTTLTLPDICAAMESEDGEASGKKYKEWFNNNLSAKFFGKFTADDCYFYRCSVLHQGRSQHSRSSYSKILFVEPNTTRNIYHLCSSENYGDTVLIIDVKLFCITIIQSVEEWLVTAEKTELFKTNCEKFMKRHPEGIFPHIGGVPVIS